MIAQGKNWVTVHNINTEMGREHIRCVRPVVFKLYAKTS
jgi:hypothetical protein